MAGVIPILDTEHLRLHPFTLDDAARVRLLASAAEVATMMVNIPHPYPAGLAEAWIGGHAAAASSGELFTWAIVRRSDATLMGCMVLTIEARHQRREIAYWLGLPFWGQGYATEAGRCIAAYGFASLGLHRLEAKVFPRNVASARVLGKIGLRYEGVLRGYIRRLEGDTFEDVAIYAMLRAEFEEQRQAPL
jgi:RimJ/RimL family protein N-acetyltransferase